jgi:hypothetical protein
MISRFETISFECDAVEAHRSASDRDDARVRRTTIDMRARAGTFCTSQLIDLQIPFATWAIFVPVADCGTR